MSAYSIRGEFHILNIDEIRRSYYAYECASILYELNKELNAELFPFVTNNENGIAFNLLNGGNLSKSRSLGKVGFSDSNIKLVVNAIRKLHILATNPSVPEEKRCFCRNFRFPDPITMPDAYRITKDGVLHILWGFEKVDSASILPISEFSSEWKDGHARVDFIERIRLAGRRNVLKRIFSIKNLLLITLLGALLLPNVKCELHNCYVGHGVWNYFLRAEKCPHRCTLTILTVDGKEVICNRHLNKDDRCLEHRCVTCGKELPLKSTQAGECDSCFWAIK